MGKLTPLRLVWLALCVLGVVLPFRYFLAWFAQNGVDIGGMVDAWHANDASSGLVWDLTVAALALTVWIVSDAVTRRDWLLLASVPATYLVGVSLGLPLHLFLRSR